jgi:hypothetical protein
MEHDADVLREGIQILSRALMEMIDISAPLQSCCRAFNVTA